MAIDLRNMDKFDEFPINTDELEHLIDAAFIAAIMEQQETIIAPDYVVNPNSLTASAVLKRKFPMIQQQKQSMPIQTLSEIPWFIMRQSSSLEKSNIQ